MYRYLLFSGIFGREFAGHAERGKAGVRVLVVILAQARIQARLI
jgi:hypothetical protein